jgi:hypothetical protein
MKRMIIEKVKRDYESCNFCKSGKLNASGNGLIYDYDEVYMLATSGLGGGVKVTVCPACANKLKDALAT